MFSFSKIDKHARLKDRMTDTLGVDMVEELQRGHLTEMEFIGSIRRCQACADTEACANWLDEHAEGAETAPSFCRNKGLLNSLAGK